MNKENQLAHCIDEEGKVRWHSTRAIDWKRKYGRLHIHVLMKRKDGFTGRMGGGWDWKVGIMKGGSEVILELFVLSIRLRVERKMSTT